MIDFIYRTETISQDEILKYFVETVENRSILNELKSRNPTILVGSRGVGKSFLLRVAESEIMSKFETERVLPVYVTFNKSSLINTSDPNQFRHWMLALLCGKTIRTLRKCGLLTAIPSSLSILTGDTSGQIEQTRIETLAKEFEDSGINLENDVDVDIDISGIPTVDQFKEAIEDLCHELNITRLIYFIDEAAHVFLPEQQRQFFTLYRDLRSPYIVCNAAVYPGVTFFGETFQQAHDATILTLNRDILSDDYVSDMREIVEKQADSSLIRYITKNGQNFALIAYASSGNPRILLKTLSKAPKVNSSEVNKIIREYYRTEIWSEHSNLVEKYPGYSKLIDWGRQFIEDEVLPELQNKNNKYLSESRNSTCFFWIHRDAPQAVKEALRLLAYTGIVTQHSTGIKATRSQIGTRYMVNLGCLFALESAPAATAFNIAKKLTSGKMSEYGANHSSYQAISDVFVESIKTDMSEVLRKQLDKDIDVLDLTNWEKDKLKSLQLHTIGKVLQAPEIKLKEAYYVGDKRARRIHNTAQAAVNEYLLG